MTIEEQSDIILRITEKCRAAGLTPAGQFITIEEMLISPEVGKIIFGVERIAECGKYLMSPNLRANSIKALNKADIAEYQGMRNRNPQYCWDQEDAHNPCGKVTAWRFHQHKLLDFFQSYNTEEMLRYVEAYV